MNTRQIEKQNWDKQKLEDQNFYNALKKEKKKANKGNGYLFDLIEKKKVMLSDSAFKIDMYLKRTKYTKLGS